MDTHILHASPWEDSIKLQNMQRALFMTIQLCLSDEGPSETPKHIWELENQIKDHTLPEGGEFYYTLELVHSNSLAKWMLWAAKFAHMGKTMVHSCN